jgi:maltooligosyltrehalose trehalohydrolase
VSPYAPLLFMGEEHGEPAPFQFFTDHIDEEIAGATRDGRRREFADFTTFAAEDVPDPQDPATFTRSKLTWQEDPGVLAMVRDLLAVRRELPAVDDVEYDEADRWVRVRRGGYEAVMNFGSETLDLGGREVVVATPGGAPGGPRSGALVR